MKKILIVNNNMHLGGVQRALVSLLWSICDRYDVTLLLFYPVGECMKDLPPNVRVICPRSPYRCFGITKNDACGAWNRLCRSFYAAVTRLFGRKYAVALMSPWQRKLKGYDVAISYLHDAGERGFYGGCNDFVLRHVEAERKIAFLHCDYRRCGANTEENRKKYAKFDAIAACSRGCADSFTAAVPELKEKVHVVKNCHRFDLIWELSSQESLQKCHCEERSDVAICTTASESPDSVIASEAWQSAPRQAEALGSPSGRAVAKRLRGQTRSNDETKIKKGARALSVASFVGDTSPRGRGKPGAVQDRECRFPRFARNDAVSADACSGADSLALGMTQEAPDASLRGAKRRGNLHDENEQGRECRFPRCARNDAVSADACSGAEFPALGMTPSGCGEERSADSNASSGIPKIRILTVARLGKEKGVDRALRAIATLGERQRKNLRYTVIGDGIERPLLEKIILDEHLSDCVRLLGALDNPYAHIRSADLLLIPSNNEAAPLVVVEAACLGTPILSTETSSAREMIEKTGFGWVCENSVEALAEALAALLDEPTQIFKKKSDLLSVDMTNDEAVSQFEQIIERR